MQIVDAQVHAYERDKPERPWHAVLPGPPEVTGADMVRAMDAVGVAGAILVSPYTMYRYDASYALETYKAHPGKFGLVKPVDVNDPGVAETIADWAKTDGAVGIRIMMAHADDFDPASPGVATVCQAAAKHGLPINILAWGMLDVAAGAMAAHPDTRFVLDHIGLKQPFAPPVPENAWGDIDAVLALAEQPNLAIKITGACTLSHDAPTFGDIWGPLARIFDAYGLDRCLWGTDWTRAVDVISYEDGVRPFLETDRLSDSDRATLMGGSLEKVYGWRPG